jgi:hypothetical protein
MVSIAHTGKPINQVPPAAIATALTTGNSGWFPWNREGERMIEISGTFNGATVGIEMRHKDRPFAIIPVKDKDGITFATTSAIPINLDIPPSYEIRITTTGGGGSQSINAYVN